MTIASFKKAIAPALLGVIGVLISWVATGELGIEELRIAGAALATSIAVYVVPNIATSPFLKALVPSFVAVVAVCTAALERGEFSEADLRLALAGLLTSAVVYLVKNEGYTAQPILGDVR